MEFLDLITDKDAAKEYKIFTLLSIVCNIIIAIKVFCINEKIRLIDMGDYFKQPIEPIFFARIIMVIFCYCTIWAGIEVFTSLLFLLSRVLYGINLSKILKANKISSINMLPSDNVLFSILLNFLQMYGLVSEGDSSYIRIEEDFKQIVDKYLVYPQNPIKNIIEIVAFGCQLLIAYLIVYYNFNFQWHLFHILVLCLIIAIIIISFLMGIAFTLAEVFVPKLRKIKILISENIENNEHNRNQSEVPE